MIGDAMIKADMVNTLALAGLAGEKWAEGRASARGRVSIRMHVVCEATGTRRGKRELQVSFDSYRRSCVVEVGPEYFNKESEL